MLGKDFRHTATMHSASESFLSVYPSHHLGCFKSSFLNINYNINRTTLKMSVQSLSHKMQQQAVTHSRLYAPLNPKTPEIRVVKLLPSQDFNAPIECELSHRPLYSESDGYESLSYVWGAPEFVGEILLSGESQPTTRNLEMALRYLRLPSCARTLWVDAICINQSDPIERGQQVRLMRDIYANCKMDLAWMLSYKCTLEPPETGRDGESSVSHPSKEKQLETIHQEMETIGKASKFHFNEALSFFLHDDSIRLGALEM